MRDRAAVQLQEDLDERLRAVVVRNVTSHVTTGEPFTVLHTLGTIPGTAMALPYTNCNVWSEEADRRIWDTTKVVLRCSVSAVPMDVLVVERGM